MSIQIWLLLGGYLFGAWVSGFLGGLLGRYWLVEFAFVWPLSFVCFLLLTALDKIIDLGIWFFDRRKTSWLSKPFLWIFIGFGRLFVFLFFPNRVGETLRKKHR